MSTEVFAGGIRRKRIDSNIVLIKGIRSFDQEIIDEWATVMAATIRNWPNQGPIGIISDYSGVAGSFTQYARAKINEVLATVPTDRDAFIVAVVPDSSMSRVMNLFVQTRMLNRTRVRVVADNLTAFQWIKRMIEWSQSHT